MNHSEKQFLTRTSPMVIEHITTMLQPLPELSPGYHTVPIQHTDLSDKESKLFWKYHGSFSMEFIKAVLSILPINYSFVTYDHLNNKLTVDVS